MSNKLYDSIAKDYDFLVAQDIENFRFPYSEHAMVHEIIAEYVSEPKQNTPVKVLDIGIGTASLYEKIIPERIALTGIDNCEAMLEIAKLRVPEATLINHNIKKGLPHDLADEKYDFIIISYVVMNFDFEFLIYFIDLFKKHLAPFGKLLIGDIMFYDEAKKNKFINDFDIHEDSNMYFHIYEEVIERLDDSFDLSFMEINQYTGLIIVEKLYQNSLQFEETLVQYKSNTEKWKSTHPEKKSE